MQHIKIINGRIVNQTNGRNVPYVLEYCTRYLTNLLLGYLGTVKLMSTLQHESADRDITLPSTPVPPLLNGELHEFEMGGVGICNLITGYE